MTKMDSRTVSACAGLNADTVPAIFLVCRMRVDVPLFFNNSDSIFLRIAYDFFLKHEKVDFVI